jgi:hypothetical protein
MGCLSDIVTVLRRWWTARRHFDGFEPFWPQNLSGENLPPRPALTPCSRALTTPASPNALRDDGRNIVDGERYGALESMQPRDNQAKPAIERVSGYPRFVQPHCVPAANDHGRLNALTAAAGNALDVETRQRHTEYCSWQRRWRC